jgi:hypothetical protein
VLPIERGWWGYLLQPHTDRVASLGCLTVRCGVNPRPCMFSREIRRTCMSKRREQVSVPIPSELRQVLETTAQREDRTLAGQIRHILAEAVRRNSQSQEAA